MKCFQCGCSCNHEDFEFDEMFQKELRLPLTLHTLTHSNIGWYVDRETGDSHMLTEWFKNSDNGIYFLWYKDEYCDIHHLFHFQCLYVGKGSAAKRIADHWLKKNFDTEGLVYFTFFRCENRVAKYIEQLVLDIYDVPFNKYEKRGRKKLCGYFTQNEVD